MSNMPIYGVAKECGIWAAMNMARHLIGFQKFVFSSGVLLLCTALAKIVSAFGSAQILQLNDPVFSVSFKTLFVVVAVFELVIAFICFLGRNLILQLSLLAWIATNFLIYRLCLGWVKYKGPCPCLGSFTGVLHISAITAESVLSKILIYILVGSYSGLLACGIFSMAKKSSKKIADKNVKQFP